MPKARGHWWQGQHQAMALPPSLCRARRHLPLVSMGGPGGQRQRAVWWLRQVWDQQGSRPSGHPVTAPHWEVPPAPWDLSPVKFINGAALLPPASNSAAGHQQVALLRTKTTKVIWVPSRLVLFAPLGLVSLACLTQAPSSALQLPMEEEREVRMLVVPASYLRGSGLGSGCLS